MLALNISPPFAGRMGSFVPPVPGRNFGDLSVCFGFAQAVEFNLVVYGAKEWRQCASTSGEFWNRQLSNGVEASGKVTILCRLANTLTYDWELANYSQKSRRNGEITQCS